MKSLELFNEVSLPIESEIELVFDKLWPICRSLTGNGITESFKILQDLIPLEIQSVPSGTKVHDWEVPKEWNINDAYILDPDGKKIVDFKENNLHVLNYSIPIKKKLSLEELQEHLYSREDLPEAIPYVTSYYKERWGFCLSEVQRKSLVPGEYEVFIGSTLENGVLKYGELLLESTTGSSEEILLSSYLCHPSMANNELSGPICLSFLYKYLASLKERKYNYRFYIGPETIGAISFLSKKGKELKKNCIGGFVLTCCGDDQRFTFKRTRIGDTLSDRASENILNIHCQEVGSELKLLDFFPMGSDERQYCSPGYNLPIASIMRTMYGDYPEYHTSLDNKDFISMASMKETIEVYAKVLLAMEINASYENTVAYCEPQLGKRDLYPTLGTSSNKRYQENYIKNLNYILNFSDGENDLLEIAKKSGSSILDLYPICLKLEEKGVLKKI